VNPVPKSFHTDYNVVIDPTKSATVVGSRFVPLASARRSDTKYRYCIHHDLSSSAFIFKNIEPNVAAAQIAISADTALTPSISSYVIPFSFSLFSSYSYFFA
jgi:hypothetical protein